MRKFILSADGKYNVRFILIVLQPVSMTRIPLIAEIQRRIRPGESMFYPNSGRIVPVPELSFQLHAQLSGKIIIALRIHMLIKNPRPCFRKRILFHAGILQIDERRNLPGPFRLLEWYFASVPRPRAERLLCSLFRTLPPSI